MEQFAEESGFTAQVIKEWRNRLERKRHIVLQGPPGTGKTYVARRLAKLLASGTRGVIDLVQFHPSYSYEDFIQGIRPVAEDGRIGFKVEPGRFLEFCTRAAAVPDEPCVLIVDEINRANLSRVFGELMYLLEYRDGQIPLATTGTAFCVPRNVYLIGTMNTADRSIALVDHALRRRFSFIFLGPQYEALERQLASYDVDAASLVATLRQLNAAIGDRNYQIGTSFFLADGAALRKSLPMIWTSEIEPYLEEYFYDQPQRVDEFRWEKLRTAQLATWSD